MLANRISLIVAALLLSASLYASDTTKINDKIVTTGMSVAEVMQRVGRPDRTEDVQNVYGATVAQRWEYWQGRRQVTLVIQSGKVIRIDEV
jgi:hypothetical protein